MRLGLVGGILTAGVWVAVGGLLPAVASAAELKLIPSVELKQAYNDNVLFSSNAEVSDGITTLRPGVEAVYTTEDVAAKASARAGIIEYWDNAEFNDVDQDYRGNAAFGWSERLTLSGDARFTRDSLPDRDLEVTGLIFGPVRRDQLQYGAGARYALTERLSGTLAYSFTRETFDDEDFLDSDLHFAALGLQFARTQRLTLGWDLQVARAEFATSRVENVIAQLGLDYRLGETWRLQGSLGGRYTHSRFEVVEPVLVFPLVLFLPRQETNNDWGWVGGLSAVNNGQKHRVEIELQHDVRLATGQAGSTELSKVRLYGHRRLTEDLRLSLELRYYRNRAGAAEFTGQQTDEQTFSARPALSWRLRRDLDMSAGYSYVRVEDRHNHKDAVRNAVFAGLIWRYPVEF